MADVRRSSEAPQSGAVLSRVRPVTAYVMLVVAAGVALVIAGLVGNWPPTAEQLIWLVAFALACAGAEELSFRIHRDWSTAAGTVPHMAAAALLLPEWAALAGAAGAALFGMRHRLGPSKTALNAASVALAVGSAAHLIGVEGRPHLLTGEWPGPIVGVGATLAYYAVSVVTVAGAVALDQHRSFPELVWNRFNFGALAEIGLGVTGLAIAIMLNLAPVWGAALLLPAVLVYVGKRTQAVLRRTEVSLQEVLAHAPDAVILVGENGLVLLFNTAAERMFATAADAVLGRPLEVLIPRWGQSAEQPAATYAVRASGDSFPIEATLSTTTYEAERLTTVIVRDITDRKRVEDERLQLLESERSARAQAEAALHQRDEFLSVAAHELKTPVANLRAYAEMMLLRLDQQQPDLRRLHQVLERVGQQSEKLGRLVSQLLDVASLEAGQFKIDRKAVDLSALVQNVLEAAQTQTSRHTLQLDVQSAVVAEVDALRVEQVLTNLVDNAVKYSPDGGVIAVEITAPDAGTVQLAVRDHGVGIAPEMLDGLFGRFFRAHDQDYASGLGLGLYISRQIVKLHDGEIRAEFPPNGGVRMVVVLPAVVRGDARHAA